MCAVINLSKSPKHDLGVFKSLLKCSYLIGWAQCFSHVFCLLQSLKRLQCCTYISYYGSEFSIKVSFIRCLRLLLSCDCNLLSRNNWYHLLKWCCKVRKNFRANENLVLKTPVFDILTFILSIRGVKVYLKNGSEVLFTTLLLVLNTSKKYFDPHLRASFTPIFRSW